MNGGCVWRIAASPEHPAQIRGVSRAVRWALHEPSFITEVRTKQRKIMYVPEVLFPIQPLNNIVMSDNPVLRIIFVLLFHRSKGNIGRPGRRKSPSTLLKQCCNIISSNGTASSVLANKGGLGSRCRANLSNVNCSRERQTSVCNMYLSLGDSNLIPAVFWRCCKNGTSSCTNVHVNVSSVQVAYPSALAELHDLKRVRGKWGPKRAQQLISVYYNCKCFSQDRSLRDTQMTHNH